MIETIHEILSFVFGEPEQINGRERCPTYLYRWLVSSRFKSLKIYIHHFVGNDWSRDLHDHPKRFISIGLWGWYLEERPCPQFPEMHTHEYRYQAPWIRSFPATHIHRLRVPSKNCWTLVIVLKPVREWGFWHLGKFIPWRSYVNGDNSHIADKMRDC